MAARCVRLVVALCCLQLFSVNAARAKNLAADVQHSDEDQIYSLVIAQSAKSTDSSKMPNRFVIQSSTELLPANFPGNRPINECFSRKVARQFSQVFANYNRRNQSTQVLAPNLQLPSTYEVVDKEQFKSLSKDKPPPQAVYVRISAIGFNAKRTLSAVSVIFYCGDLCELAQPYLLEKHGIRWQILAVPPVCGGMS